MSVQICGVCEPECPIDAIVLDTESGNEQKVFISLAKNNKKKDPPEDSDKFKDEKNKFEKFLQENIK